MGPFTLVCFCRPANSLTRVLVCRLAHSLELQTLGPRHSMAFPCCLNFLLACLQGGWISGLSPLASSPASLNSGLLADCLTSLAPRRRAGRRRNLLHFVPRAKTWPRSKPAHVCPPAGMLALLACPPARLLEDRERPCGRGAATSRRWLCSPRARISFFEGRAHAAPPPPPLRPRTAWGPLPLAPLPS